MAPLQIYELFNYKYILKYTCFLKKHKKMCTKIYIKNALQEVTNITRTICGSHLCTEISSCPHFWLEQEDSFVARLFIYFFHFWFHKPQSLKSCHNIHRLQRQSEKPNSLNQALRFKIAFIKILQKLVFCGKMGAWFHILQEGAGSILKEAKAGSHRGPKFRGRRKEESEAEREPADHPPPCQCGIDQATEMRSRSKMQHAFGGRERAGMARRGSLRTVPSDSGF